MISRVLLVAVLCATACSKKPAPPPPAAAPPAGAAASDPATVPAADLLAGNEEVKPAYETGPALPLAQKLCAALYELPDTRRAQCCSGKPRSGFGSECVRVLSAALRAGGVALDEGAVDRCIAAQGHAFEGCAWVGQWQPALPAECEGLLRGKLGQGAVCRSSLECAEGQNCLGVGPTDPGRCGPPRSDGQACATSVDPLAVYARQGEDPRHHPECAGYCGHRKCEPLARADEKCSIARQCANGLHCDGQKCVSGAFAAAGEKCVGGSCARGLRCVENRCAEPKADGATCKNDYECRGGCAPDKHVCGMRCDVR